MVGAVWQLWQNNKDIDGAAPFLMTQAATGMPPQVCGAPTPTLLEAVPASGKVTLTWSDEHSVDPSVQGYQVYYDQAGKSQLHADVGLTTSFTDTGLQNGEQYCYTVTSYYGADCESGFSNVLCAVPEAGGGELISGVSKLETGKWVTSGKGKNQTTEFVITGPFNAGDDVVIRAYVVDTAIGAPLANATVDITISGPGATVNLTTGPSDVNGMAEATWQTQKPNKRGQGGTAPGTYSATTTNVTLDGYSWDGVMTSTTFTIQ